MPKTVDMIGNWVMPIMAAWCIMLLLACEPSIESVRQQNILRYSPMYSASNYNPQRVRSVNGFIKSIRRVGSIRGSTNISLIIETPNKKHYEVELGPELYVMRQNPHFELGEKVVVIGDVDEGTKRIVAERVIKKNTTLKLRNAQGEPLWTPSFMQSR